MQAASGLAVMNVGKDVEIEKHKNSRVKRGECPTCGTKLFKVSGNHLLAFGGKKKQTPITKNGKILNGRCLLCHPIEPEEEELKNGVPKILVVNKRDEDEETAVSEITLDRRLKLDEDNMSSPKKQSDDIPKNLISSRHSRTNHFDDHELESLTESENDDPEGSPKLRRSQHRSMANSSHHNGMSMTSSARNRWGESVTGIENDNSTAPRPLPPKRVPSTDGCKQHSSKVTVPTLCNTTSHSSPNNIRKGSNHNSKIPRIIIPNSPAKKSNFTPPWNPSNQNSSSNAMNARKPGELGKDEEELYKEIVFNSSNMVPCPDIGMENEDKLNSDTNVKEITLFGQDNFGLKRIPNFDDKVPNFIKMSKGSSHSQLNRSGHRDQQDEDSREIHVDLTAFVKKSPRKISPPNDLTPRTLKRQKALNVLVPMEQIFSPSDLNLSRPPKRVERAASSDVDGPRKEYRIPQAARAKMSGQSKKSEVDVDVAKLIKDKDMKQLLSSIAHVESPNKRIAILHAIKDLLWDQENCEPRKVFASCNGMEVLATVLWTEMMHPQVQTATLKLLLALGTNHNKDEEQLSTPLSGNDTEVIMDAILISMETNVLDAELQETGCQVLCCFASELSASAEDYRVDDGTRSGACLAVLTALAAHKEVHSVQEWGVRALYNQCVHSQHAEANKRTVLTSKVEHASCDGSPSGSDTLIHILKTASNADKNHVMLLEWTCKLMKALSASVSAAEMLAPATELVGTLLSIVRQIITDVEDEEKKDDEQMMGILEDVLETVSSLLSANQTKKSTNANEVVVLMLNTMGCTNNRPNVVLQCLAIISKLASDNSLRKSSLVNFGVVNKICDALVAHAENTNMLEAGIRGLACLSLGAEVIKQQLCVRETLDLLLNLCDRSSAESDSVGSIAVAESMCSLIASLYSSTRLQEKAVQGNTIEYLRKTMARSKNSRRVQQTAFVAFMNLSTGDHVDLLAEEDIVQLVVDAMESNIRSEEMQIKACSTLWNLGVKSSKGCEVILKTDAIDRIIAAIQNHLESQDVVDMACGSLWGLANASEEAKKKLLKVDGGMETIAWILVMHPDSLSLQEKACGVVSSASSGLCEETAEVAGKGVSNMVDAMRCNPKSIAVLQAGAQFLRQVVLFLPSYSDEACDAISVLIKAMKANKNAHSFQQDACNLLWTIAEQSPEAKEKILNMDGVSVLMEILDRNNGVECVENAALGAFKELALKSN